MAQNGKKSSVLLRPKIYALSIFLICVFAFAGGVIGAALNTPEESQEIDRAENSNSAPSRINIARVRSAAQRTVQEEALKNNASGSAPPSPLVSKGSGSIKKVRNMAVTTSSDKSEMKQVRGPVAIQDDDSLSSDSEAKGKASKGKSSANKDDSF